MKTKISLLVLKQDQNKHLDDPKFLKFLLNKNGEIPSKYLTTKQVDDTLKDIAGKYTNISPDILVFEILDARKSKIEECEIVYSCRITHDIKASNKIGTYHTIDDSPVKDDFYVRNIRRQLRVF